MPRHARTFQLPPERFWYAPEMRRALARRDIAEVLRQIHRKLDWTQLALSTVSGYSQGHISKWLAGKPFDPDCLTFKRLEQFAVGFGIPMCLFGVVDQPLTEDPEPASSTRGLGVDEVREEDD